MPVKPTTTDEQLQLVQTAETLFGGAEEAWQELGVARASWFRYRAGTRVMPKYVAQSIRAHSKLDWHRRRLQAAQERASA